MRNLPQSVVAADICDSWVRQFAPHPMSKPHLVAFWQRMGAIFRDGGQVRCDEYRDLKSYLAMAVLMADSPRSFASPEFRKTVVKVAREALEILFIIEPDLKTRLFAD